MVSPAGVTLLAMSLLVGVVIYSGGGDPLALARLGDRFNQGIADGSEGYDGQFVYYIARDPGPSTVRPFLDVPAYRYQRILMPLLARGLALGSAAAIPWTLVVIGVLSQTAGTALVGVLLESWGVSRWYALTYGMWVGFGLAVRLDLPEPLAYALIAGGVLALERNQTFAGWLLFGLALFAKEVTALFLAGYTLELFVRRRLRSLVAFAFVTVFPYLLFQVWLWRVFGQPGVGSGGAYATPFEIVPFMGLARIGLSSTTLLVATLVVFVPAVIAPALWGLWAALRDVFSGVVDRISFFLLANAAIIPFLPFSTYREPGGVLRFACGLVMAILIYTGRYKIKRALNYGLFWLFLNVFLLK